MQDLETFLASGDLPRTQRERGVLLDQLRSHFLQQSHLTNHHQIMLYKQSEAHALHAENAKLRAAAGMPQRRPIVGCIGQSGIKEIVAENEKLSGKSKTPFLDALVASHEKNPNGTTADHLAAVAAGIPTFAARSNAAPEQAPQNETVMAKKLRIAHEQAAAARPAAKAPAPAGKTLTKAQFDTLTPQAKMQFFREGGRLI